MKRGARGIVLVSQDQSYAPYTVINLQFDYNYFETTEQSCYFKIFMRFKINLKKLFMLYVLSGAIYVYRKAFSLLFYKITDM